MVQQALAALRRLGAVLCGVLPPRDLADVAGAVLQALAARVVGVHALFLYLPQPKQSNCVAAPRLASGGRRAPRLRCLRFALDTHMPVP